VWRPENGSEKMTGNRRAPASIALARRKKGTRRSFRYLWRVWGWPELTPRWRGSSGSRRRRGAREGEEEEGGGAVRVRGPRVRERGGAASF
jgi:hypothetical protein